MFQREVMDKKIISEQVYSLQGIVKIGLLSAIAVVLTLISMPIPIFPAFLKIDIGDLPALIGGFALGPVAGIIVEFIKNVFNFILKNDGTGGIGNLSNFIVGVSFVVPASIIYMKEKTKKGAITGMIAGVIFMVVFSSLSNYYVIVPLYAKLFSMETIMNAMKQANPNITDMKTYIIYAVIPFNIIKGAVVSIIALLIYKKVSPILRR